MFLQPQRAHILNQAAPPQASASQAIVTSPNSTSGNAVTLAPSSNVAVSTLDRLHRLKEYLEDLQGSAASFHLEVSCHDLPALEAARAGESLSAENSTSEPQLQLQNAQQIAEAGLQDQLHISAEDAFLTSASSPSPMAQSNQPQADALPASNDNAVVAQDTALEQHVVDIVPAVPATEAIVDDTPVAVEAPIVQAVADVSNQVDMEAAAPSEPNVAEANHDEELAFHQSAQSQHQFDEAHISTITPVIMLETHEPVADVAQPDVAEVSSESALADSATSSAVQSDQVEQAIIAVEPAINLPAEAPAADNDLAVALVDVPASSAQELVSEAALPVQAEQSSIESVQSTAQVESAVSEVEAPAALQSEATSENEVPTPVVEQTTNAESNIDVPQTEASAQQEVSMQPELQSYKEPIVAAASAEAVAAPVPDTASLSFTEPQIEISINLPAHILHEADSAAAPAPESVAIAEQPSEPAAPAEPSIQQQVDVSAAVPLPASAIDDGSSNAAIVGAEQPVQAASPAEPTDVAPSSTDPTVEIVPSPIASSAQDIEPVAPQETTAVVETAVALPAEVNSQQPIDQAEPKSVIEHAGGGVQAEVPAPVPQAAADITASPAAAAAPDLTTMLGY